MDDFLVLELDLYNPQDCSEAAAVPGEDSQERLAHSQLVQGGGGGDSSLPHSSDPPTEPEIVQPSTNLGARPKSFERAGPSSTSGIPVIIASMVGGHYRCLAADKTECAYVKYNPFFGREDGAVKASDAPSSDSQGCHNLSVNRQMFMGDLLSLNEVAPMEREVITDTSSIDYNVFHCQQELDDSFNTSAMAEDSPTPTVEAFPFPVPAEEFDCGSGAKGRDKKGRYNPAICNGCQKTFSQVGNRNIHLRMGRCRGSNVNISLFSCPGCGHRFKLLQHLSLHIRYTPACHKKIYKT